MDAEIQFHAEFVAAEREEYTSDCVVVGIYFGEGDPERGGQHWNFTQDTAADDGAGVCTVKEIQQMVLYGGVRNFVIGPRGLVCEFSDDVLDKTKVRRLAITYDISQEKWAELREVAQEVFRDESCFELTP